MTTDAAGSAPLERQVRPLAERLAFAREYCRALPAQTGYGAAMTAIDEAQGEIDRLRAALLDCVRRVEALKQPCGLDPASTRALRNGQYMSIAAHARLALGPRT